MEQTKYKFDQVAIRVSGGGYNLISRDDFLKKSINERIDLIMKGLVQFLHEGKIISVTEALGRQ